MNLHGHESDEYILQQKKLLELENRIHFRIIHYSKIKPPDIGSGYTLDDNARALIAMCTYFKLTGDEKSLYSIRKYLHFIKRCLQPSGDFLNFKDKDNKYTDPNKAVNLDIANGRAVWALGYIVSFMGLLPYEIVSEAITIIEKSLLRIDTVHSTKAMAFAIKGIYYYLHSIKSPKSVILIKTFANRLVQKYRHESDSKWEWFEDYLTYSNSIFSEAMLYAWLITGETIYKDIAGSSFDFLLSQTINENRIEVISNKKWFQKGQEAGYFGEQPIDVAYTILVLSIFYNVFQNKAYHDKMETAFTWFLRDNRLHQIVDDTSTDGIYAKIEESHGNLNQDIESKVSYLMARLTIEEYMNSDTHSCSSRYKNSLHGQSAACLACM